MDNIENNRVKKKHLITGSIIAIFLVCLLLVLVNLSRISNMILMSTNGEINTAYGTYSGDLDFGKISGTGTLTYNSGEIYTGEMLNAELNGLGKMEFPAIGIYTGEFDESVRNGEGTFTWLDGSSYTGTWSNDKVNGFGTITFADKSILDGVFQDGLLSSGTYTAVNGDKYEYSLSLGIYEVSITTAKLIFQGTYNNGIFTGTIMFINGDIYTGDLNETNYINSGEYIWVNGTYADYLFNIDGTIASCQITFSDGGQYKGQINEDAFHGEGTYTWPTGETYYGDWDNGEISGEGTYTLSSGEVFSGTFETGTLVSGAETLENEIAKYVLFISESTYTNTISIEYSNGTTYSGEYSGGAINGQGQMNYANGDVYYGEFKDGLKSGTGTYTWTDGDKYVGSWSNDKMNGTGSYYFGGSSTEYFEGKFSNNVPTGNIKYITGGRTYTTYWSDGKCTSIW